MSRRWRITNAAVTAIGMLFFAAFAGIIFWLGFAHGGRAAGPTVGARPVHDVVVVPPSAPATPLPSAAAPAAPSPAAADQAAATAGAFLVAYASFRIDDTPDALRARLRPYDTDRLDAVLAQGGASGPGAPAGGAASVAQVDVVGLAPDGRLVLTAQVTVTGGTRYVELYLASTAAGWRVDEVAL